MLALMPMAVPGLVLGLGYIFFFNSPSNPLNLLYGTMPLLVLCTIVHFYTSAHLTATTALNALDPGSRPPRPRSRCRADHVPARHAADVPARGAGRGPLPVRVRHDDGVRRGVPVQPKTVLAAVAVLNMDDAGFIGPAAAMCAVIASSAVASLALHLASRAMLAPHPGLAPPGRRPTRNDSRQG